jgi:hypothetical protein
MIAVVAVALLWLLLGAYLIGSGQASVGLVGSTPLPDAIALPIIHIIALIIGPPMWIYAVVKEGRNG